MTLLDDLAKAVERYATDEVKTEIVNFTLEGEGVGTKLNPGEKFTFRVKISNQGVLFMKGVTVGAAGAGTPTPFAEVSPATSGAFDLAINEDHTTGLFHGTAKIITSGFKTIVTVRINGWDPDFNNMLRDRSGKGAQEGLTKEIVVKTGD